VADHPLDGAQRKLDWARKHLNDLDLRVRAWRWRAFDFATSYTDERGRRVIEIRTKPPPGDLGPLISTILAGIRDPLDYLVNALSLSDTPQQIGKRETHFPLTDSPANFDRRAPSDLKGLSQEHVAAVKRTQPFNPGWEWLGRLRDLSKPDKRCDLTALSSEESMWVSNMPPGFRTPRLAKVSPQTEAVRRAIGREEDIDVYLGITVDVGFDDRAPVVETLDDFETQVRALLNSFKPEF
jgi:hypothetical protein